MITPGLILDSHEQWLPMPVESIIDVGGKINGRPIQALGELVTAPDQEKKRIDFPKGMAQPLGVNAVGYHRVVSAGGLWWHQFWTWWLYNPKKYAGFGEHEGDWEMVQIGCVDKEGNKPVLITCSQHDGGEKREFWRVTVDVGLNPIIFVARDSHANYFEPHQDVTDTADGKGLGLVVEWRMFDTWHTWLGKWGNSDNSPGPLIPRRAWQAPHAYHSQARG